MEEDNNSNPPPNRPYRVRRPSSSLISSTTSFPVPPNPLLRSSINRAPAASINQRDIDEDIQPSSPISSSSSSFTAPSSRQRAGPSSNSSNNVNASSSSNYGTNRSSSPLGSPDSTFWGPNPSPGPVNSNLYRSSTSGNSNNIRGPPTPGGMCVVSSSTIEDDIPPSPFSPAPAIEDNGNIVGQNIISHRNINNTAAAAVPTTSANVISNSVSVISGSNNYGITQRSVAVASNDNQESNSLPGPSSSSPLLQGSIERGIGISSGVSSSASTTETGQGHGQYSNFSSPSSSSYLSPLRNKIKKASSFERFSAQAQASINNSNTNKNINSNNNSKYTSPQQEINVNANNKANATTNSTPGSVKILPPSPASSVPGPSRLMWEYVPGSTSTETNTNSTPSNSNLILTKPTSVINTNASSSSSNNNLQQDTTTSPALQFNSKPFLIKKLAAKIASVLEQKQLAEASNATTQFPSIRSNIHTQNVTNILPAPVEAILHEILPINDLNVNSPLNLTDNSTTATIVVRNPNSIIKTFSKKIPMPPKQKILQRMQSGEFFDSLSPPPSSISAHSSMLPPLLPHLSPPQSSSSRQSPPPVLSQIQQQQLLQQEQLLQPPMYQQLLHESLQQQQQQSGLVDNISSLQQQHSPQSILDRYNSLSNYDAFNRSSIGNSSGSSDEFSVQDVLTKSNIDCSTDPNIQVLYDDVADAYAYYYGNILSDEIFPSTTGGNSSSSSSNSRPFLIMPSNLSNSNTGGNIGLHDEMGNIFQTQQHGHLEFGLGLNPDDDDESMQQQQHERIMSGGRDVDDIQLSEVGLDNTGSGPSSSQHVQFLDSNETNNSLSKLQNDSTLRNLLMMQPLRNHDDSWITATASNEYQNSFRGINSGGSGLGANSILGNALLMNMMGNNTNSSNSHPGSTSTNWINDWAPRTLWQQQHSQHDQQTDDDSGGDQDEVMDMSVMDIDKTHNMNVSNSSIIVKRGGVHNQTLLDHNGAENLSLDDVDLVSERELVASAAGLPPLHEIPLDLQLQQQVQHQPLSLNIFGKGSLMDSSASSQSESIFLKHHIQIDPQQHHRSLSMDNDEPVNLMASTNSEQEFMQQHQQHHHHHNNNHHSMSDGNTSCIVTTQDPNNSCMTILTTTSSTTLTTTAPGQNFGNGFDSILQDSIEEKHIIRFKKVKETGMSSETFSSAANFIPNKPVQAKAFGSLPSPLTLIRDEDNIWRVFNRNKIILCNTRFGPVEGPMEKVYEEDLANLTTSVYPYLVQVDDSNILWHLDRTHDELCNWMKFARLAHSLEEQNTLISECNDSIYFTTSKDILPKTELRVGYSLEYAEKYGFPYIDPAEYGSCDNEMEYETQAILTVEKQKTTSKMADSFQCFECDAEFSKLEDMNKHLATAHDSDEPDGIIRRPKKKVLKKYYNSENVSPTRSHTANEKHKAVQKDPLAPDPASSNVVLSSASCQTCGMEFSSENSLEKHAGNCPVKEVIGSKYEKFPRKKAAMENALVQDSGNNDCNNPLLASSIITTTAVSTVVKNKNKCQMCYKSFAAKDRLERHMIVHSDEDSKPLKCPSCTKRFLTNSALAGHVKTHAEEGKCFECPMCEFTTQQLLQLKEHVQTHRRKDTGMFHCHRCTKKFSMYAMCRKHIRAFHGPRMFPCDHEQCPMMFPTCDKLKLHKLKHSDHREFLCAECGRQFKRRDKLVEHAKRMHDESKQPIEVKIVTPAPLVSRKSRLQKKPISRLTPEEFDRYIYRCADCMVGFKRRGMLVNHLAKRHPEKTPQQIPELNLPILKTTRNYFCLYCERVYKSSSKRKSHILKSHPGKPLPPQLRGRVVVKVRTEQDANGAVKNEIKTESACKPEPEAFASSDENGVSASGIQLKRISVFNDTGKVVATPHSCQWCHRQYATRAKLLQHQRKSHLILMPPDMQLPRTQKNNVLRPDSVDLTSDNNGAAVPTSSTSQQNQHSKVHFISTKNEIHQGQLVQYQHNLQRADCQYSKDSQVSGSDEVIGFFLTANISNGELNSLLQQSQELVVVPMTSLPSNLNNEVTITSISSTNNNLNLPPASTGIIRVTTSTSDDKNDVFQNTSPNNPQQHNNNVFNQVISTTEPSVCGNPILTKTAD